jgi:protein involved in polysaccharide export with SLBB domain
VLDVRLSDLSTPQSTLFTVSPSGFIEHPNFTEPIAVSGLTADEVSARLEADLKRRALNTNPKVLVGVRDYVSHAILVSGLVKEPGTKILRREAIPLYVVVADAQPLAEAGRVTVVQRDADKIINVDLQDAVQMNRLVRPGDVVTLQPNQSQFVYVGGEVKNAGERPYRRGLTLTQVILSAGGLTREAKEIQLARDNGGGFLSLMKYKLKEINNGKVPDPPVQPGDRITVLH